MTCLLRAQSTTFHPSCIKDTQGTAALSHLALIYQNDLSGIILCRSVRKFHHKHRIWIPFDFNDRGFYLDDNIYRLHLAFNVLVNKREKFSFP